MHPLVIDVLHRKGFCVRHKKTFNAGLGRPHVVTGYNVNSSRLASTSGIA